MDKLPKHSWTTVKVTRCRHAAFALAVGLTLAVATPTSLPAMPLPANAGIQLRLVVPDISPSEVLLVHCCHSHPRPPYDRYCCHSSRGYVYGRRGYAGSVRRGSRRVSRRTSRRVSRRRR